LLNSLDRPTAQPFSEDGNPVGLVYCGVARAGMSKVIELRSRAIQEVATAGIEKVRDEDTRNTLLLGVAAVAIAAALSMACQKRISGY
jgi:hypothetical protein